MSLVENIKRIRKEKNWSQTELAKRIGAHISHINRIENGKYAPTIDIVMKIADAFEVSIDYLVGGNGNEQEIRIENKTFAEKIHLLNKLDDDEREIITRIIDAFLTKKRMVEVLETRS